MSKEKIILSSQALLSWHLFIDCPYCEETIDLADIDEDGWVSSPIFSNKWDLLKGEKVECSACGVYFSIDKVDY